MLVGPNSAGKSTIIEAVRALCQLQAPSFTQGRRNQSAGDEVCVRLTTAAGHTVELRSTRPGSSETTISAPPVIADFRKSILALPARRAFDPFFSKYEVSRDDYMHHIGFPFARSTALQQFTFRLFAIAKNRAKFDDVLRRVLDPVPDWTIDQADNGDHFVKVRSNGATHSSEGLGDGLVSLLYIIDALYDSTAGQLIAIDEPELSLHPALQRRLAQLFAEFSSTRQIVIATHSPFMVDLDALANGASIARVHKSGEGSVVSQLSSATAARTFGLMRNRNNPHIFGLNAQEVFFVPDKVVLVEGQDDVVYLERVQRSVGVHLSGTVYGWGVGGAENMELLAATLTELGFTRLVGMLDGNRSHLVEKLSRQFPSLHFFAIPADDIRTKREVPGKEAVQGLLDDDNREVRHHLRSQTEHAFRVANAYLVGTEGGRVR